MPWFLIQRKIWTKYLVRAKDRDSALKGGDEEICLGYVNGEGTEVSIVGGPFESEASTLDDPAIEVQDKDFNR